MVVFSRVVNLLFPRINELREDHDYSIKYVAGYLTMHRDVYSRYEKGIREIPVWALIKLAELYDVSVDYILGLTNETRRA